ncbi:transcriptional regulator [Microbacterium sorbitolivorans]|nr:sugar-binding domain-containing protein [Microbacterium sorbitolivorans]GGF50301.1 transcriptional regulator [Microbacterium sorbitolivorans]
MYYLEDATQASIADRLGVSRPTVSRLLADARRAGIVRIEVLDPFIDTSKQLATELRDALGLNAVYLAPITHPSTLGADLAAPVSEAVRAMHLTAGDALLISSGQTTYELAQHGMPALPGIQIAPTVGGYADPLPQFQTNEITRIAAQESGAFPAFLFTQALPSAQMRRSLLQDPAFQHVSGLWERATGALLGIGAATPTRAVLASGIPADDRAFDRSVGDVCLNFFATDGQEIEFPGSDLIVRTPPELLRNIPHAVGVAVGTHKVSSITGAVRGGLINELVTDSATARAILDAL